MTQLLIRLFVRHPDDTKNAAVRTAYGNLARASARATARRLRTR